MKNLLQHYWQSYWLWVVGLYQEHSHSPQIWCLSKKKYHHWKKKLMASLKRKRRKKRKMINERTIILLLFLILLVVGLSGCNTNVCPDKTTVEVGVTETDSKNDKLQEKKSITQTWKWGKKKCNDG